MKSLCSVFLITGILISFRAYAVNDAVSIGPVPKFSKSSPALHKSLVALRSQIESDARDCVENAQGMESIGNYNATLSKTFEAKKVVGVEVTGTMICDGVHSSSYRYGVAFETASGRRFDLNRIYNIAVRQNGHLLLRPELVQAVELSYRSANANNPSCLADADLDEQLTNFPLTFSPEPGGSIALYYAVADLSAGCFPVLHLQRSAILPYRDGAQALRYGLP